MQTILITGGAGFIGGNFVHYWAQANPGDSMVVLDAATGATAATIELPARPGVGFYSSPVSAGGAVWIGHQSGVVTRDLLLTPEEQTLIGQAHDLYRLLANINVRRRVYMECSCQY